MNNSTLTIDMRNEGVDGAVGRVLGIQVKDKIIRECDSGQYEKVLLDFSKVDFVTSGFAKELFGGLYTRFQQEFNKVVMVRLNKENETLKNTIIRAIATVIEPPKQ